MDTTQLQNNTPHSFPLQYVLFLSKKIVKSKYTNTSIEAGSLATIKDLPFLITTNLFYKFGGEKGCLIIQKENVNSYKSARSYLQTSIQHEAQDVLNKGHHHGSLRRDKETGVLRRTRHICSTEMRISDDSNTIMMDVLEGNTPTPEQHLKHQETYDLAKFIHMLTVNILNCNHTSVMGELTNIPSLSPAGLLKHCMYTYGIEYANSAAENNILHSLIQNLWNESTLPSEGLVEWNSNLTSMKSDLLEAEANFSFIIKQYILRAIKPNESVDELFASDTPRESLRKSLGHSEAGVALLNLVTLMHLTSKDEYHEQMVQVCKNLLDNSMKVFSEGRKHFTDLSEMENVLETLLQKNMVLTRDSMRRFLAPIVYDQCFDHLTTRKQNTIRRLIRSAGMLCEGLRPLIIQTKIPLAYR